MVGTLATVYFPDIIQLLDELEAVAAKYYMWMLNAGQKRRKTFLELMRA
jgi:hypothetical protein